MTGNIDMANNIVELTWWWSSTFSATATASARGFATATGGFATATGAEGVSFHSKKNNGTMIYMFFEVNLDFSSYFHDQIL